MLKSKIIGGDLSNIRMAFNWADLISSERMEANFMIIQTQINGNEIIIIGLKS